MTDSTSTLPENVAGVTNAGDEEATAAFARMLASESTPPEPPAPTAEAEPDSPDAPEPSSEELPAESEPVDEESEEPESQSEPVYAVKAAGEELQVPLSELLASYTRHADYTRKTKALAAERSALETANREAESRAKALDGVRAEYQERLTQLAEALRESQGEPDWEALQAADPMEFATKFASWQVKQQRRQAVEAEQARVRAATAETQKAELAQLLERESRKLLEAIPAWKDTAKAQQDGQRILAYAESLGFTKQDLSPAQQDHRLVRLLHDAARYHELAARVQKAPIPATKAAATAARATPPKPGARPPVSDLTRARQRLAKTGLDTDAEPVFLALLQAERAAKGR